MRDRLSQDDAAHGFLLDGYPRNTAQVAHLESFLAGRGESLDAVILLDVPREESLERLTLRATEQGRSDDTPEAIGHRLDIYERETAPIIEGNGCQGQSSTASTVTGALDDVTERITAALAARGLRLAASAS